jgi:hypothetical protein
MPCRDSSFSSFSALNVSRPDRSMSSQTTAANLGAGGFGFGEQVGHASVAGDARVGEGPVGVALAAGFQVDGAELDVPVDGGDEPPGGQPVPDRADLPPDGGAGVLKLQGGGAGEHGDGEHFGRDGGFAVYCGCWDL